MEQAISSVIRELDLVGLRHRPPTEKGVVIEGGIEQAAAILVRGFREAAYSELSAGQPISSDRLLEGRRALLEHVLKKLGAKGAFGFVKREGNGSIAEVHDFVMQGTELTLILKRE